jgi:hypothetical protein
VEKRKRANVLRTLQKLVSVLLFLRARYGTALSGAMSAARVCFKIRTMSMFCLENLFLTLSMYFHLLIEFNDGRMHLFSSSIKI